MDFFTLTSLKPFFRRRIKSDEGTFYMKDNPEYKAYEIGRFTYGKPLILEWGEGASLSIGSFCSIADDVTILLGGNHRGDWVTTFPFNIILSEFKNISGHPATKGDVIIGHDVWIGRGSLILSGVQIGDGAIIAAHSVVTKNVSPYTVIGGNPARKIKSRFREEIVDILLELKWWNWDLERIKENIDLMMSTNIEGFIDKNR